MTISFNWLSNYLPEFIDPEKLSKILTAIGLEVESMEKFESLKGGLEGLLVGEVIDCIQHPNADKLKLTTINTGNDAPLQIVCGAPNVAAGQKVIIAPIGATIFPLKGEPVTMKVAKIRGIESYGMICAEDEIGLSENHDGILILPETTIPGTPAASIFRPYTDTVYEIGLTPNRMDAMSHIGVAKDVCAYLNHHSNKATRPKLPFVNGFKADNQNLSIAVQNENKDACKRYSGISISNVKVAASPKWLQNFLKAIGQKPINNIVDITNYILHETGQPLHAFDADAITGKKVVIKNLSADTVFQTLDNKERKLRDSDLMICNAEDPMCIAGVFGGIKSGVTTHTRNIFLESAWFNPIAIRQTYQYHNLRTEAATHFEKGVDISATVLVLKRAALLIKEIAGGEISSEIVDDYSSPAEKTQIAIKYHYLKKLSGKNYHPDAVKKILESLGFEILKEGIDELRVAVPFSKPDITLPADVAEEVIRIDGIDNIEIPTSITLSPGSDEYTLKEQLLEKMSAFLTGIGFNEMLTNSITNSKYYDDADLKDAVKMINSLSADLDIMRPSMLPTGLECIAYNINRRNNDLTFFEFGKTYKQSSIGAYKEEEHLCLYLSGNTEADQWQKKGEAFNFYMLKGMIKSLFTNCGINDIVFEEIQYKHATVACEIKTKNTVFGFLSQVSPVTAQKFDIKQSVFYADLHFAPILQLFSKQKIVYREIPKYPSVQRDLSIITNKQIAFSTIASTIKKAGVQRLQDYRLFDIFESDKLGDGKKAIAINFTFVDEEKTLTDKEIDSMMQKIIQNFEKELSAEIRK